MRCPALYLYNVQCTVTYMLYTCHLYRMYGTYKMIILTMDSESCSSLRLVFFYRQGGKKIESSQPRKSVNVQYQSCLENILFCQVPAQFSPFSLSAQSNNCLSMSSHFGNQVTVVL
jgi:hypothetical protein